MEDLLCPACQYNLRGLLGPEVKCPECGGCYDLTSLVTERWKGPWHRAPGLTRLFLPVAIMALGLIGWISGVLVVRAWLGDDSNVMQAAFAGYLVGLSVLWVLAMWHAVRLFGSSAGFWLALLGHVILVGYLVSVFGSIGMCMSVVFAGTDHAWGQVGFSLLGLAAFLAIGGLSGRGERFAAACCIRRYLQSRAERGQS